MSATCAHCGLPLPRRPVWTHIDGHEQGFCCTGCFLIFRITGETGEAGTTQGLFLRLGLSAFFAMNAMAFTLPTYFPFLYPSDSNSSGEQGYLLLLHVFALLLTLPVIVLLGVPILLQAARDVRGGLASVDVLIALGSLAAFGLSVWNTAAGVSHVYFDTVAMLLVLVALGRFLEARAKMMTAAQLTSLLNHVPSTALRLDSDGEVTVPTADLVPGDRVRILPGQACPVDGTILVGTASVDESSLTGESRPITKDPGKRVAAGTFNLDGSLEVLVDQAAKDSMAARIARLLEQARTEKSPAEQLAERVASLFLPLILSIAVGTFVFWTAREGSASGILTALAVLVVACPCAFGIATPAATWIALGRAARHGILIRSGVVLERLGDLRRLYLDKTGTLTTETLDLSHTILDPHCPLSEQEVLERLAALQRHTLHPLARAVQKAVRTVPTLPFVDVRYHAGLGIEGWLNSTMPKQQVVIGSWRFAEQMGLAVQGSLATAMRTAEAEGRTTLLAGWDGRVQAVLLFHESLRPETEHALARLQALALQPEILTGAATPLSTAVSRGMGAIPIHPGLLPADKVKIIQAAAASGLSVGMVGDGINDAPALAAATVGIALGTKTDLTREAADINVLEPDLGKVVWLIEYACKVRRVVRQNLWWAFGYNGIAIVLAASGHLNPLVAALAMILSSVCILSNSRRLAGS